MKVRSHSFCTCDVVCNTETPGTYSRGAQVSGGRDGGGGTSDGNAGQPENGEVKEEQVRAGRHFSFFSVSKSSVCRTAPVVLSTARCARPLNNISVFQLKRKNPLERK